MLNLKDVNVSFGNVQILWDINIDIGESEIVSIIGSNGAGKSTLLKTIVGLNKPKSGKIEFKGTDITLYETDEIVKGGICLVPEGRELFLGMTVIENIQMGAYFRKDKNMIQEDIDFTLKVFPRLAERLNQLAGTLSGGEQQMVAIGRAFMGRPSLLLIDELSLGLSPILVDSIIESIKKIHKGGTSILLVEQDVQVALENSQRGYVLDTGKIILSDESEKLIKNPEVVKSYLGII